MKIGIDLSPIQGPHRMRGIGYTLINFINHLPETAHKKHTFVFYILPEKQAIFKDSLSLLNLNEIAYETRFIGPKHKHIAKKPTKLQKMRNLFKKSRQKLQRNLPKTIQRYLNIIGAMFRALPNYRRWDSRPHDISDLDIYLQADPSQNLPRGNNINKSIIIYDIIPYVLEWDYLWTYETARVHGFSRKAALRCQIRRKLFVYKLGVNIRHADTLLSISETTKNDFITTFPGCEKKIYVTPLGVPENTVIESTQKTHSRYQKTSWGYTPTPFTFEDDHPFILFVGGADKRRKLQDVVIAFNQLRAQGTQLNLVLAGDSMQGPKHIATEEIQEALQSSSYLDDIIFMGFIDDATRNWLYHHAAAFIFPSRYEGFGLPVLEAMSYGCPVISYINTATVEVAGDAPLYVSGPVELQVAIESLLNDPKKINEMRMRGLKQVQNYSWSKTSEKIIDSITR